MKKLYDKLVRDHIPAILEEKGIEFTSYQVEGINYWERLKKKLDEETKELLEEGSNFKEELADVLEVVQAMLDYKNIDLQEIEDLRLRKKAKKGGFSERIVLDSTLEGER